jgi:tetratricopeptide (TPR) repeat protein
VAEYTALKYRAFLSFSLRDKPWAKWLHGALDTHPIDRDIVGRWTPLGPVPKTLRPIYRDLVGDGDNGSGGQPLTERTIAALQASRFLIVICSPEAVKSPRVNEEIRRFNAMGRADRVIPVIVDGEPGHSERECLPPALRFKLDPDRQPTNERGEPIAVDARPGGDGKDLAEHKVVAALLGLRLDEVEHRATRARQRRRLIRYGMVGAVLALIVAYHGGVAIARQQLAGNEILLDHTLARATALTSQAVAVSERLGVPPGLTAGLLGEAESLLNDLAELAVETPRLRLRKAAMLIAFARNYAALDIGELQRLRATQAEAIMQALGAETAGDLAWQQELATTYDQLGDLLQAQGRVKQALASYRASVAIAERLAADPNYAGRQHELAINYIKVGDMDLARGALDEALASYGASYDLARSLAAADPGDARWQHDVLVSYQKIGDVQRLQGDLYAALASYQAGRDIAAGLVAADPGNADWQRGLAVSQIKIGDVLALQGKPHDALASYRASHAIAERFAETGNASWQNDLGVSHERMGSALESQGDLVGALKEYRASLAIATRLAAADRGNAGRQRTLGIAYEHVGDVLRALDDLGGALMAYDAKRAIISRLAAADPGNALWQYDLGVSHARIGLVQENRGDFAAALQAYLTCLGIGSRLAAGDPDNAGWMRDLAVSYGKLAQAYHRLGKTGQALAELRKGRDIMAALVETAPGFVPWTQDLARLDDRIAAIEGRAQVTAKVAGKQAAACEGACVTDVSAKDLGPKDAGAKDLGPKDLGPKDVGPPQRDVIFTSDLRDRTGAPPAMPAKISN